MNFVFVLLDQLRADSVGTFGTSIVRTPNLDRLGTTDDRHRGIAFDNCYVQNTVCTPSRCSIFTGWYPHVHGHRTIDYLLDAHEPNMLRTLRSAGYWVEWYGKNDLLTADAFGVSVDHRGDVPGFGSTYEGNPWPSGHRLRNSFYFGRRPEERSTRLDHDWVATDNAVHFLSDRAANPRGDQPFFLYLPFIFPHPPYYVEEPYFSMYNRADVPPPARADYDRLPSFVKGYHEIYGMHELSDDDFREIIATYYGMVTRTDALLGRLLDTLETTGLADDTTVIVTSDHGDYTGDYGLVEKWWTGHTDNLTRVPLYVRVPRNAVTASGAEADKAASAVSHALVESIDILPTVIDLADVTADHSHFGRSLLPVIRGDTSTHRDAVFAEGGHHPEDTHCRGEVMDDNVNWGVYRPKTELPHQDFSYLHNAVMVRSARWKYIHHLTDMDELYDLEADPREERNLAAPAHMEGNDQLDQVVRQHQTLLLDWYMRTADVVPLRAGPRDF